MYDYKGNMWKPLQNTHKRFESRSHFSMPITTKRVQVTQCWPARTQQSILLCNSISMRVFWMTVLPDRLGFNGEVPSYQIRPCQLPEVKRPALPWGRGTAGSGWLAQSLAQIPEQLQVPAATALCYTNWLLEHTEAPLTYQVNQQPKSRVWTFPVVD